MSKRSLTQADLARLSPAARQQIKQQLAQLSPETRQQVERRLSETAEPVLNITGRWPTPQRRPALENSIPWTSTLYAIMFSALLIIVWRLLVGG